MKPYKTPEEIEAFTKRAIEAVTRAYNLQNRNLKPDVLNAIVEELFEEEVRIEAVESACKRLSKTPDMVSFYNIMQEISNSGTGGSSSGYEVCKHCGTKNEQGEYVATGYMSAVRKDAKEPHKALGNSALACCCDMGGRIASKSNILRWNGTDKVINFKDYYLKVLFRNQCDWDPSYNIVIEEYDKP